MRLWNKRASEPPRPALVRSLAGWSSGEWPPSYEHQVCDAYLRNPIAQRAVRIVAEGAAAVPIYAVDDATGAHAAKLIGAPGLIETLAMHLLLNGNGYVQIAGDADGMPATLYALRPERVTIEPDARGWPAAYLYRAGEVKARLPASDGAGQPLMVHLRALNPIDDHYGVGSLGCAAGAVAIHNAATKWNRALLDNAARPSGALVYETSEGAALSPEQFERLKAEMEAGFAGASNAGKPMLLEGGLRWQAMSLSPADMDFVGLKASAARDIALAFGVPPMLLGLPGDNTYANYSEANRALWRQTIVPLVRKIVDGIGAALRAWWPEAELELDLDAIPALVSDRQALWAQVSAADFLSIDEKRGMLGFGKVAA